MLSNDRYLLLQMIASLVFYSNEKCHQAESSSSLGGAVARLEAAADRIEAVTGFLDSEVYHRNSNVEAQTNTDDKVEVAERDVSAVQKELFNRQTGAFVGYGSIQGDTTYSESEIESSDMKGSQTVSIN